MKFHDYTISGGEIYSQRIQDTEELAPTALRGTMQMLRSLQAGQTFVEHGIRGLPRFGALLGLPLRENTYAADPELAERMAAPGRFFCVATRKKHHPFQINLVLPYRLVLTDEDEDSDKRAIATLLGISTGSRPFDLVKAGETIERIWSTRPLLATILLPYTFSPDLIMVAADFSTCFAAAILLDD